MPSRTINTLILGAFLAPAISIGGASFVSTEMDNAQIRWASQVKLEQGYGLKLTISGPGDWYFSRQFEAGAPAAFNLSDNPAGQAIDGSYTYELVAVQTNPTSDRTRPMAIGSTQQRLVSSGSFLVADGSIVNKDEVAESDLTRDQQILDDLIVDGSACIGQDCVNGESFGFDTIRLKENNLRIKFQDTSTSASFPSNDWQITANDSANGGANKFSIDDIDGGRTPFTIEAGAPSNSLYVENSGEVGLGTANPVVELHVVDGDTPTLRLEQDGTSGFTPQTWDLAGNETNFFVRDVTNGSNLPFRIRPGAPSNSIFIDTDGDVGLGTSSPSSDLDISADGPGLTLTNTGSAGGSWEFLVDTSTARLSIVDRTSTNSFRPLKIEDGSNNNLLRIGIDGTGLASSNTVSVGHVTQEAVLDVRGSINVDGATVHADYVFDPSYDLKSIESHADFMWNNKHLPSLPKAPEGLKGPVNLVDHQMKMLEELEVAHIYIDQLNTNITQLKSRIDSLEKQQISD